MTPPPVTGSLAPIVREVLVRGDASRAFSAFTDEIDAWWPKASHSVYGADATVVVEDGQIVEMHGDQRTVWGELLDWEPPRRLRTTWHPGTDLAEATEVEVEFLDEGDHVRVRLTHTGWERRAAEVRERYLGGWAYVLGELAAAV